jgi:hypothetical protein
MSKSLSRDTIEVRYRYLHRTMGIMGTFIILAVPCWSLNGKNLIFRIRKEKPIKMSQVLSRDTTNDFSGFLSK